MPHLTILLDADPQVSLARVDNKPSLFDRLENGNASRVDDESERRFEQTPLYDPIKFARHGGSDFFFVPKSL